MKNYRRIVVTAAFAGALCLGSLATTVGAASVQPAGCTPGYSPCIPNRASDVDCAGGSGNGPRYTKYGVEYRVSGSDRYGLDADNDGWGCE